MTGVAVPLLLALLLQLEELLLELLVVDILEQEPAEQQLLEELLDEQLEFEEAGLRRLRSLLGLETPSLL